MREELAQTKAQLESKMKQDGAAATAANPSAAAAPSDATTVASSSTSAANSTTQDGNARDRRFQTANVDERLSRIEENQQMNEGKIDDQYQTKIESSSKYRVRLSGVAVLNLYTYRGQVDNADFPALASPPDPLGASGAFGGSLRQSRIGLEVFGPDIWGAHTSAGIQFDFAGGFSQTQMEMFWEHCDCGRA